jgi:hypothetical protein
MRDDFNSKRKNTAFAPSVNPNTFFLHIFKIKIIIAFFKILKLPSKNTYFVEFWKKNVYIEDSTDVFLSRSSDISTHHSAG